MYSFVDKYSKHYTQIKENFKNGKYFFVRISCFSDTHYSIKHCITF